MDCKKNIPKHPGLQKYQKNSPTIKNIKKSQVKSIPALLDFLTIVSTVIRSKISYSHLPLHKQVKIKSQKTSSSCIHIQIESFSNILNIDEIMSTLLYETSTLA